MPNANNGVAELKTKAGVYRLKYKCGNVLETILYTL